MFGAPEESDLLPNTAELENEPLITAMAFAEYDERWAVSKELISSALGAGLGDRHLFARAGGWTQGRGGAPMFRSYSL